MRSYLHAKPVALRLVIVDQGRGDCLADDELQEVEELVAHEKRVRLHYKHLIALPEAIENHAPHRMIDSVESDDPCFQHLKLSDIEHEQAIIVRIVHQLHKDGLVVHRVDQQALQHHEL